MGALTLEKKNTLIKVPRRLWDPTEGVHSRHGERALSDIYGLEVHWVGPGSVGDHGDTGTELLSFERFHEVSKGWYDLFYNVGCDTEAITYEGRDWTIPSQSDLRGWLTFLVVLGDGDHPTATELAAIEAQIITFWRAIDPEMKPSTLRYHGMRADTACPGPQMRAIVNNLRANPPKDPTVPPTTISHGEDMIYFTMTGLVPHCWLSYAGGFRFLTARTVFGSSDKDPAAWKNHMPTVPCTWEQLAALRDTARRTGTLQDNGADELGNLLDERFWDRCPYTPWPTGGGGGSVNLQPVITAIEGDGRSTRNMMHQEHVATRQAMSSGPDLAPLAASLDSVATNVAELSSIIDGE